MPTSVIRRLAAVALVTVHSLTAHAAGEERSPDAQLDALLFQDSPDMPGFAEQRRLLAEIEPERWELLREILRRTSFSPDDAAVAALVQRGREVEASARDKAIRRIVLAPVAALDALERVSQELVRELGRVDPAACVAWGWPDDGAAEQLAALPRQMFLSYEVETLKAALAARRSPTPRPEFDEATGRRLRAALEAQGLSPDDVTAANAPERPKDRSDIDLCALLIRLGEAKARLPDDLRTTIATFRFRGTADDRFGPAAERLARVPTMPDAAVDEMMFTERLELPDAGRALRVLAEVAPDLWAKLRPILRADFRPIDDADIATTAGAVALNLAQRDHKARLIQTPDGLLETLARQEIDANAALGAKRPDLCAKPGRFWDGGATAEALIRVIPAETARFSLASGLALIAARDAPVKRPVDTPEAQEALDKALKATGYTPPNAGASFGDLIKRPPDAEGGYCKWRCDYLEALLKLPTRERALGLALYLASIDKE